MTKKYNTPMLQVVSISSKDIIATSNPNVSMNVTDFTGSNTQICAPDRFNDWDAGY